jgi:GxxExxY protein
MDRNNRMEYDGDATDGWSTTITETFYMEDEALTQKIIGCAMAVHRTLGPGFLESVYQKAFAHELVKAGLKVICECPIRVRYDGVDVGEFAADMLVESRIVIENKAVRLLAVAHETQLVHYLTATGLEIGLLFNFGAERLQFKRKSRLYRPPITRQSPSQTPLDAEGPNPVKSC